MTNTKSFSCNRMRRESGAGGRQENMGKEASPSPRKCRHFVPWFVGLVLRGKDLNTCLAKEDTMPQKHVTIFALIMYRISQNVLGDTDPIAKLIPTPSVPHLGPGQMTGKEDHLLLPVTDVNFVMEW